MKKEEFLQKLEYLLQDIPEVEKRDALDYYRDYLEEAGTERESDVLKEFGSPERIAAMIRTDLMGGMKEAGEFTDQGFEDSRFEKNAFPSVRVKKAEEQAYGTGNDSVKHREANSVLNRKPWIKYILCLILFLLASPVLMSAGLGVTGGIIGIFTVLAVFFCLIAGLTFVGFCGGGVLCGYGILHMAGDFWFGFFIFGLGLFSFGAGCLLFLCAFLFYGKFLPWLIQSLFRFFKTVLRGRSEKKAENEES